MKFSNTKGLVAAALLSSQMATAALINIEAGSEAYLGGVEADFLSLLQTSTTETFDSMADGTASYSLAEDVIAVTEAVIRRDNQDIEMSRISMEEYLKISELIQVSGQLCLLQLDWSKLF